MNNFKKGDLVRCVLESKYDPKFNLPIGKLFKVVAVFQHDLIVVAGSPWNHSSNRFEKIDIESLTKLEKLIYNLNTTNKGE
jgi:hypothetical protein